MLNHFMAEPIRKTCKRFGIAGWLSVWARASEIYPQGNDRSQMIEAAAIAIGEKRKD